MLIEKHFILFSTEIAALRLSHQGVQAGIIIENF
jgi:hypothetical protein